MDATLPHLEVLPKCRATLVRQSDVGVLTLRCALDPCPPPGLDDAELVFVPRRGNGERTHPLRRLTTDDGAAFEAKVRLWETEEPVLAPGVWDIRVRLDTSGAQVPLLAPSYGAGKWPRIMVPAPDGPYRVSPSVGRGAMTLQVAQSPPYVEVDRVDVAGASLRLDAHMVPDLAREGSDGRLSIRSRDRNDVAVRFPVELTGDRLRAAVDLEALPSENREHWDFYLQLDGEEELRLGAHLDEIHKKQRVFSFPCHTVDRSGKRLVLQPFYTIHNDLSVRVLPAEVRTQGDGIAKPSLETATVRRPLGRRAKALTGLILSLVEIIGRLRRPRSSIGRRKVYFIVAHVFGVNGVNRTVLNLASHLAQDHDVQIISVGRARKQSFFKIDPRVKVTSLLDKVALRESPERSVKHRVRELLSAKASWLVHEDDSGFGYSNLWLDLKLLQCLHSLEPGVLITPRVSFNVIAARFARPGVITVGQEHLNFISRQALLQESRDHYSKLDAVVALTESDRKDFRKLLADTNTRVFRIPNALPGRPAVRADLDTKRVIAASNYIPQKGLELLIAAFEKVVYRYPDWHLRVYGGGPLHGSLQRHARELRLHNHVLFMGPTDQLDEELARSSIFVLSSRAEGFPMVLLEAMAVGLPIVSFDCPTGPSDLITDGVDGTLVPPGDVDGLAAAILDLIENLDKRHDYSKAALETARSYEIDVIAQAWRRTFDELLGPLPEIREEQH